MKNQTCRFKGQEGHDCVICENEKLRAEIELLKVEAKMGNIPYKEAIAIKQQLQTVYGLGNRLEQFCVNPQARMAWREFWENSDA